MSDEVTRSDHGSAVWRDRTWKRIDETPPPRWRFCRSGRRRGPWPPPACGHGRDHLGGDGGRGRAAARSERHRGTGAADRRLHRGALRPRLSGHGERSTGDGHLPRGRHRPLSRGAGCRHPRHRQLAPRSGQPGVSPCRGGRAPGRRPRLAVAFPDITRKPWALRLTDEFKSGACHAGRYEGSIVLAARPDLGRRRDATGTASEPPPRSPSPFERARAASRRSAEPTPTSATPPRRRRPRADRRSRPSARSSRKPCSRCATGNGFPTARSREIPRGRGPVPGDPGTLGPSLGVQSGKSVPEPRRRPWREAAPRDPDRDGDGEAITAEPYFEIDARRGRRDRRLLGVAAAGAMLAHSGSPDAPGPGARRLPGSGRGSGALRRATDSLRSAANPSRWLPSHARSSPGVKPIRSRRSPFRRYRFPTRHPPSPIRSRLSPSRLPSSVHRPTASPISRRPYHRIPGRAGRCGWGTA